MPAWPSLPFEAWKDTYATLHLWLQIVGKIRLAQCPWVNHQWHVALQVTASGLASRAVPHGTRTFDMDLDFVDHRLRIAVSDGHRASLKLQAQSVASFYRRLMQLMAQLGVPVAISTMPNEIPNALPFDQDEAHCAYDAEYASRFWRALAQAERVFQQFRARYHGKCSPVHFFWGSADLAVTRFSGRRAPQHPGGIPNLPDRVVREAYSHECSSCGFWPGAESCPRPIFYSYAYPAPEGFAAARVAPAQAGFDGALGEFVLPYDAVRESASPDDTLLEFMQSTYDAAAQSARWEIE